MSLLPLLGVLIPSLPSLGSMTRHAAADVEPLAPRCFAYVPRLHAFACVGHDRIYNMDHVGADDQATNIRIDVIGPGRNESWTIAAIGGRPTTRRAAVEKRLAALGMKPIRARPVEVSTTAWTQIGAEQLFLRVEGHDGDASFENFGELTLRCSTGVEVTVDLRARDIELGDTAVAWREGGFIALSIVGVDGGEDTAEFSLDTAVIDVVTTCQKREVTMWTTSSGTVAE